MLLEQDKINYQAEERKITKKFREHLLTVAEYIKKLKALNKVYYERGDLTKKDITEQCY